VNPFVGTNYLDTVSAFIEGFLHLLAGEGVWGRGRQLSPFPSCPFEIFPLFSLFSKNTIVALRDSAEPDVWVMSRWHSNLRPFG